MKKILQRYEMLSGQAINYNKSSVIFSPNTWVADKTKVCANLGVQEKNKPGK